MTTWGVSAQGHDAAIAVFHHNNELVFAAHAERYSRVKNDPQLNNAIVHEALRFGEPEKIVWYEDAGLKWVRRWLVLVIVFISTTLGKRPRSSISTSTQGVLGVSSL